MLKKLSIAVLLALLGVSASAEVWQARYGVAETFNFKLYNADGTLDTDEADGGTEVSVSCNEGAETTATNDFADEGTFYSIALTSAEMECERIAVVVAATTTEVFFIQTSANASAMTPTYEANVASHTTGAIEAADFAAGAIDAAAIAADAIGASEIATDAIGAAELAADAVGASEVATDAIGAAEIAANAIAAAEIASDAFTNAKFDSTAGAYSALGIVDQGTAQAATGTTLQLRSAAAFADDEIIGATCLITGGSAGVGQARSVTDYVSSTDTATVATWTTTPTGTITYRCFGTAASTGGSGATAADVWAYGTRTITTLDEDSTTIDLNASFVGGVTTFDEDTTTIDINATTLGTVTTATTATNLTNLPAITANWLTAVGTAADYITEVQTAAAAALTAYDPPTNTEMNSAFGAQNNLSAAQVNTEVDTALADYDSPTNAELTTALGTADDAVLAAIAALNNLSAAQLRDTVIEDQGSTISLGCALAAILAYAGGDVATSGATSTYEDPSGTETRVTGTVASAGNRTATITCPSY